MKDGEILEAAIATHRLVKIFDVLAVDILWEMKRCGANISEPEIYKICNKIDDIYGK
jgi:hypothetical protein